MLFKKKILLQKDSLFTVICFSPYQNSMKNKQTPFPLILHTHKCSVQFTNSPASFQVHFKHQQQGYNLMVRCVWLHISMQKVCDCTLPWNFHFWMKCIDWYYLCKKTAITITLYVRTMSLLCSFLDAILITQDNDSCTFNVPLLLQLPFCESLQSTWIVIRLSYTIK
jgi:hypothetical protein